ncbi:MAG: hypothetical protein E7212_01485 [Clostridium sartagoforme]|nr:hypothetical protein [Clostridium sartagoforme]
MINVFTLITSFVITSLLFNYLSKTLISTGKIKIKARKTTKDKVIWTIICCAIYILGYVLVDYLNLGIIGFNIARGILLALFVTMLLLEPLKK